MLLSLVVWRLLASKMFWQQMLYDRTFLLFSAMLFISLDRSSNFVDFVRQQSLAKCSHFTKEQHATTLQQIVTIRCVLLGEKFGSLDPGSSLTETGPHEGRKMTNQPNKENSLQGQGRRWLLQLFTQDMEKPFYADRTRWFWREMLIEVHLAQSFRGPFRSKITWAGTGLIQGCNRRKCVLIIFHWNGVHIAVFSDVCNSIQFGRDCKDWK